MDTLLRKLSMIHLNAAQHIDQPGQETPIHLRDRAEFWNYIESSPTHSTTSSTASTDSLRWVSDSIPPPVYALPKIHLSYADKVKLGTSINSADAIRDEFESE